MASDINIAVGKKIQQFRSKRGWRQIDLAEHSTLNANYISDLEIGKKEPCLGTLKALADAFEITLSELLHGV